MVALGRPVRSLAADSRGIAAVEFALVVPVLLLIMMGVAEVGRFALFTIKVQHSANSVADLASREETLTAGQLTSIFAAARHIVRPFDMTADGVAIVSCVGRATSQPLSRFWQRPGGGNLAANSTVAPTGSPVALPPGLTLRDGESVVVAEVVFRYRPWLMGIVPDTTIRRTAFYRPRLGMLQTLG